MTDGTMTEELFMAASAQFLALSRKLQDSWELIDPPNGPGYLRKLVKQQLQLKHNDEDEYLFEHCEAFDDPSSSSIEASNSDLYQFEYHVVYSISYQVPVLYFNVHKSDGTMLGLEEAWSAFSDLAGESREQLRQTLTQAEHPALFKPFLMLHPCKTAEVLTNVAKSRNRIVSFLSMYGPFVNLEIDLRYGQDAE